MDELGDMLGNLLKDPKQMAELQEMAAKVLGGGAEAGTEDAPGAAAGLGALLSRESGAGSKAALVKALSPYLAPARQTKLNRALRAAQAIRLASAAWKGMGGEGGL